jgi:hypothetical protein
MLVASSWMILPSDCLIIAVHHVKLIKIKQCTVNP